MMACWQGFSLRLWEQAVRFYDVPWWLGSTSGRAMILYYFLGDLIHDIMIDEHEHQHILLLDIHNIYAEEL